MKRILTASILLLLMAMPAGAEDGTSLSAIADAARRSGDKSRQALVSIFGDIVNNPLAAAGGGSDTVLASLFQMTNGALLVIGGLFACYVWWRKLTQVAHDGSVFSKGGTTWWGPIRIVWGIATLVPTPNGWALCQLLMLWGASVLGVGIANLGTDAAVTALSDGKGMIIQPAMPDTVALARSVFEADLCMHSMNAGQAISGANGGLQFGDEYVQQYSTPGGFILRSASRGKLCGGAEIDAKRLQQQPQSTNWVDFSTFDTTAIYKAHASALASMQQSLSKEALDFVNASVRQLDGTEAPLPDAGAAIQRAAVQYETSVNREAGTKAGDIGRLAGKLSESIRNGGWWTLGAWYQTFAHANSKLSDAVAGKAQTHGEEFVGDLGVSDLRVSIQKLYKMQQVNDTNAVALGRTADRTSTDTSRVLGSIFSQPGQRIVYYMTNMDLGAGGGGTTNPLIKMKNLGDYTLGAAETSVFIFAGIKGAVELASGGSLVGLAVNATGIGSVMRGVVDAVSPFFLMIIIPMILVGVGLSIYLPLVPFIIWFGAIINWLVVVLEAVIAAPLWAITHLDGEGDGMGARSAHGYIFLLNVMVRPILMVIGFFGGGAMLVVGGTFLNEIFGVAIANVQFDSMTGLLSMIAILLVYLATCVTLVHSCFNLILIVPDQVINWVGGTASSTLGRDTGDTVRNSVNVLMTKLEHLRKGPHVGKSGTNTNADGIKK